MKERILKFISYLGITNRDFELKCGMSNGYINSMRKGLGLQKVENVLLAFPELNRNWLLTGMGNMINSPSPTGPEDSAVSASNENKEVITSDHISALVFELSKQREIIEVAQSHITTLLSIIENNK